MRSSSTVIVRVKNEETKQVRTEPTGRYHFRSFRIDRIPTEYMAQEQQQDLYVVLETTAGPIVLELYWDEAPRTCKNFWELAKRGYYNNTKFHRVIQNFMVQGGDPTVRIQLNEVFIAGHWPRWSEHLWGQVCG
jgi:hypothetical protein